MVLAEFHALFSKENLATVFARAKYFKVERSMSRESVAAISNEILERALGWSENSVADSGTG